MTTEPYRRTLDIATLDGAARDWAGEYLRNSRFSRGNPDLAVGGKEWVLENFRKAGFDDEFEYLIKKFRRQLGPDTIADFDMEVGHRLEPRDPKHHEQLLAERLAVDVHGVHIPGKVGVTIVDGRLIGSHVVTVEARDSIARRRRLGLVKSKENCEYIQKTVKHVWNIYAGENEERIAGAVAKEEGRPYSRVVDELPPGTPGLPVGALTTRIGTEAAQDACDGVVDLLDEGSAGAVIQGRTTPRPSQVDDAVSGTNLFTATYNVAAFGAAADAAPGGIATAAAITPDSSADATGTLLYCRLSSSNAADTPLNDHLEGEAGTSGADFNFNTLSIVILSTVDLTAHTVTMPES